jgi:hypothetical protein
MTLVARLSGSFAAFQRAGMTVSAVYEQEDGDTESVQVLFDAPGSVTQLGDVGVIVTDPTITYPASVLAELEDGDDIEVGGAQYSVREILPLDDGLLMQARLTVRS